MTDSDQYELQWRGGKKGPWTLGEIHSALKSGDVHSLYQIEVDGQWQPLREFLDVVHVKQKEAARQSMPRSDQPEGIRKMEPRLPAAEPVRDKTTGLPPLYPIKGRTKYLPDATSGSADHSHSSDMAHPSLPRSGESQMEWRHVGMAFLLLLSIVAGGIGSYAIVKMLSAPTIQSRSSTNP